MTDQEEVIVSNEQQEEISLAHSIARISQLINKEDVGKMINLQVTAIDRLERTNKSLSNCSNLAQNKLAATTKLFKRTAKQMSEAKKDLDVIYKKIVDLKGKIKAERPDLFQSEEPAKSPPVSETNYKSKDPSAHVEELSDVKEQTFDAEG